MTAATFPLTGVALLHSSWIFCHLHHQIAKKPKSLIVTERLLLCLERSAIDCRQDNVPQRNTL